MPSKKNRKSLKNMKQSTKYIEPILESSLMLYFVFFITVIEILCLLLNKDYESIGLFFILALVIYMMNTNMIVVLGIPFVVVSLLVGLRKIFRKSYNQEGFEDKNGDTINVDNLMNDPSFNELMEKYVDENSEKISKLKKESVYNVEDDTSLTNVINKIIFESDVTKNTDKLKKILNSLNDFKLDEDYEEKRFLNKTESEEVYEEKRIHHPIIVDMLQTIHKEINSSQVVEKI